MKKSVYKYFSLGAALVVYCSAMAQIDTNPAKGFKDIHKTQETDRLLEKEIKKNELQKAPTRIISSQDKTTFKMTKKDRYRKKKKNAF